MIALTWVPEFIGGVIWLYLIVWAGASIAALLLPKTWKGRFSALLLVTLTFGALPAHLEFKSRKHKEEQQPIVDQRKAQYEAAMVRFEERCKTAGEKVYRTVEDVEGVLLMKVRPAKPPGADKDPMWPGAALASERKGNEYIESFLFYESRGKGYEQQRGSLSHKATAWAGYQYVDVIDETDGQRYRYTAPIKPRSATNGELIQTLNREATKKPTPQYGITYEDIVDSEDRKHWIAGTKISVVEVSTGQIVAEQTRFLMDTGMGSTAGSRSPWSWAATYGKRCSPIPELGSETRFFVDQILKPKKGE